MITVANKASAQARQQESQDNSGEPYFLSTEPIVERLFAQSKAPFSKDVAQPLSRLQEFLDEPRAGNIPQAQGAARKLCAMLEKMNPRYTSGGRASFRRDFALATLDQVVGVSFSEESVRPLHRMLTDDATGRSTTLSESMMAGITDLNEYHGARLRRSYARDGGLCDVLANRFAQALELTHEVRAQYQRKTSRRFDGSVPEAQIRAEIDPIISRAREAMVLMPEGRTLPARFEERVESVKARLSDYHFADACRLMDGLVNDMRELKSTFMSVEGLDKRLGSKVELWRARRSAGSGSKLA